MRFREYLYHVTVLLGDYQVGHLVRTSISASYMYCVTIRHWHWLIVGGWGGCQRIFYHTIYKAEFQLLFSLSIIICILLISCSKSLNKNMDHFEHACILTCVNLNSNKGQLFFSVNVFVSSRAPHIEI